MSDINYEDIIIGDDTGKGKKTHKVVISIIAGTVVCLCCALGLLYAKKAQLDKENAAAANAAAIENLQGDSASWGVKDVASEQQVKNEKNGTDELKDSRTMEILRQSVYEQLVRGLQDGTIKLSDGGKLTEEQMKVISEQCSKEILSNVSWNSLTDEQKQSFIDAATKQINSSSMTDAQISSLVYSTINSMNLKGEKGEKGDTGAAGTSGRDGKDGKDGEDGKDGDSPVRGVDYFTNSDIEAMVARVSQEIVSNGDITVTAKSAYDIAVQYGYVGTEEEWIKSLGGISSSDLQSIREEIIKIVSNEYVPTVTKNAAGTYVLTIPVGSNE